MALEKDTAPEEGIVELPEEEEGVIDTDDGGAILKLDSDEPQPPDTRDFYRNLAGEIPETTLDSLAQELITRIEYDKKSREDRDKKYEEALKRTGLGADAPGGASFPGASRVVHPMLSKAVVDFEARAIAELFPAAGPVKDFIPGEPTKARVEKARRKVAYLNWQLKFQMPEFRSELEKLLTQVPLVGSQYLYLVWDHRKRRPVAGFWPDDDVILPYSASNLATAERMTMVESITQFEFDSRVKEGIYRDVPAAASPPASMPEQTKAAVATDKIEGKTAAPYNEDGLRSIYRVFTYADLEPPDSRELADAGEGDKPYLIEIDPYSHKVLSVVRNWESTDKTLQSMLWLIEFPFIPWRGSKSIGLVHLIGSLAQSSTGAIRALLDSAQVNNLPTLIKLKGAGDTGETISLSATTVTEIEGGLAGDMDIRKLVMAVPFNPPSLVLLQLLGFLSQEGDAVVRTTFEKLTESGRPDMPVGTTLALIEQGMKVLSAIHARLYSAMNEVILVLHRINRMYVTDDEIKNDTGELLAKRSDFEGPLDVIPVSDPEIFSDVQRFAQIQMIAQRATMLPNLYDLRKVEKLILKRTKIPEAEDLLLPTPEPQEMNAVNENVAMALGRPVAAFPEQDHLAHTQVLLDFLSSPILGANPLIEPRFLPAAMQHLAEHICMWYVGEMVGYVGSAAGGDLGGMMRYRDPETRRELDATLAAASPDVVRMAAQIFSAVPPIIQGAMQKLTQYQQSAIPPDPKLLAEQLKSADKEKDRQSKLATATMQQSGESERLSKKEAGEDRRKGAELASREQINREDNLTALTIAKAEIESGERVGLETGTGINPS